MGTPCAALTALGTTANLLQLLALAYAVLVSWRAMRALEPDSDTLKERLER